MFDAIINYAGIARKVGSGEPHLSGRHNKKLFFVTLFTPLRNELLFQLFRALR